MPTSPVIDIDQTDFRNALRSFERMDKSITPRYLKNTQARAAKKKMVPAMKKGVRSTRLVGMIGVTTAKRRAGKLGIKVGVVKNDPKLFPTFSAEALASVIEYGTDERFEELKKFGITTGRRSTGSMPSDPFLRPAFDQHAPTLMDDVERNVLQRIEKNA